MRFLSIFVLFGLLCCVIAKNHVKSLTESMGQEVIEMGGGPDNGLPPDIEEEPSAELDDDGKPASTPFSPQKTSRTTRTTKAAPQKTSPETRRKGKVEDDDKYDAESGEDDARIEKELAEIYKDTADYKEEDSRKYGKPSSTDKYEEKIIGRAGAAFKFQPDLNNQKEVEKFRTSIDEISCARAITKLDALPEDNNNPKNPPSKPKPDHQPKPQAASSIKSTIFLCITLFFFVLHIA